MRALITGITGQDGYYLTQLLHSRGYEVHGLVRLVSRIDEKSQLDELTSMATLHIGDVTDAPYLTRLINELKPERVFNLAAQSFVGVSWDQVVATQQVNFIGFANLLEACRTVSKESRIYQASTSEMYGDCAELQNELTPLNPMSPYAVAKVAAHNLARVYRESFNMFVSCGICHNHESERRPKRFVSRKITSSLARLSKGLQHELRLGNLNSARDWGHAADYVRAMVMMLDAREPDDFVIASGVSHTVAEFLMCVCGEFGISTTDARIVIDKTLLRPNDVPFLCGDARKIKEKLGWSPEISFDELVRRMCRHDEQLARAELSSGKSQ